MIPVHMRLTIDRPPGVARAHWQALLKVGLREQAEQWFGEYFPIRFRPGGHARYALARRRMGYQRVKGRRHRSGVIPGSPERYLVFTGRSLRELQSTVQVRSSPNRARLKMTGPAYFKIRFLRQTVKNEDGSVATSKQGKRLKARQGYMQQPDKVAEATKTTARERRTLSAALHRRSVQRLNRLRRTKVVDIK